MKPTPLPGQPVAPPPAGASPDPDVQLPLLHAQPVEAGADSQKSKATAPMPAEPADEEELTADQLDALAEQLGLGKGMGAELLRQTELDLTGNKLTSVPPEVGQLVNLTTLVLAHNQLTSVPPEVGRLFNLTEL